MGFVDEVKYFDFWLQHDERDIHITWTMLSGLSHPAVSEADKLVFGVSAALNKL